MNTNTMTPEQRLEAFKMCMAEAGHPQEDAYLGWDYLGNRCINMPGVNDINDPGFWSACWNANRLVGDSIVNDWCHDHFVAGRLGNRRIGEVCSCHSGTSGYPGGQV